MLAAHWTSKEFEMQHIVLDFVYLPPPHNLHTTRDALLSIIPEFQIEKKSDV